MGDAHETPLIGQIRAALAHDSRINLHAAQLRIHVQGRSIVLEGQLPDLPAKRVAARLARELAGDDYRIEDRLRVRTAQIGDGALRDKIANALLEEPVFRNCDIIVRSDQRSERLRQSPGGTDLIEASVADGVVTLDGRVGSLSHLRMAEALLWWIDGCQRVDNRLQVVPGEQDTDAEIADALRLVFEKDPFLDAGQLRISVSAGVVELDGLLPSEEQRRIAASDAWAVAGVQEVCNRVQIGAAATAARP